MLNYKDIHSQGIQPIFYKYKWSITFKIVNHYVVHLSHIHQLYFNENMVADLSFPCGSGWRMCLQCKRPGFNPWVGKNEMRSSPRYTKRWVSHVWGLYTYHYLILATLVLLFPFYRWENWGSRSQGQLPKVIGQYTRKEIRAFSDFNILLPM